MNKTFIISASTGIGAETARLLSAAGHRLMITSRTEANCVALSDELCGAGRECHFLVADVTDPETPKRVLQSCLDRFGSVEGLYNVAGISGRRFGDGPLHECTDAGWRLA